MSSNSDFEALVAKIQGAADRMPASEIHRMYQGVLPEELINDAIREAEQRAEVIRTFREPRTLADRDIPLWYHGPQPHDRYWPAVRDHLLTARGLPKDVIESVHRSSDKILSLMAPPWQERIETRGLVLGHVQSGKTTNFTALMAKAGDRHYRLFIVLSGLHNGLRNQTQKRLNADLISLNQEDWLAVTEETRDFNAAAAFRAGTLLAQRHDLKVIAIVKKNKAVLTKLLTWLREADPAVIENCPTLIIDDEADQASVNAGTDEQRTAINGLLLEIMRSLPRAAYIGYTATPFANVLIDPTLDDLYPRDFIVDLERPDNYFGPERIFGRDPLTYRDDGDPGSTGLDLIRIVPDEDVPSLRPKGTKDQANFQPVMTDSLRDAIHYFWLATAARWVRGAGEDHSGMLVHTTLYALAHEQLCALIRSFRAGVVDRLDAGDAQLRAELEELWRSESARVTAEECGEAPVSFDELWEHLLPVVLATVVIEENNKSESRLNYDSEGGSVLIVVGGNTLSRGLTLNGLVVSFFVRAASAYDTLLQMGRWFGYRDGYSDLPRIWMTDTLRDYFRDLALVEEEIRRDIRQYEEEQMRPSQFAVRIRTHPSLAITSEMKMRAARETGSYAGEGPQTIIFRRDSVEWLEENLAATRDFLSGALAKGAMLETAGVHRLVRGVDGASVVAFLKQYQMHPDNRLIRQDLLLSYIGAQQEKGRLTEWTVAIPGRRPGPDVPTIDLGLPAPVPALSRSRQQGDDSSRAYLGAITSPGDRTLDLPPGERRLPEHGLLLLYPIDRDSQPGANARTRVPLEAPEHLVGIAFDFPNVPDDERTPQTVSVQHLLDASDPLDELDIESVDEDE